MYLIFFNTYQTVVFVTQMFYDMLEFLNTVQVRLVNPNREGKKKVYDFVADTFTYIPQLTDNVGLLPTPYYIVNSHQKEY